MKWFYNLKRVARVVIAVCSWLPLFIFTVIIGDGVGENGENMQTWQALIICVLLAVGVVFTVFAIKARRKETQAERDAKRAERAKFAEEKKNASKTYYPADAPVLTMSDATIRAGVSNVLTFPIFTKAVGVTFDNCQKHIQESEIGDAVLIKHKPTEEYPESVDIINARTRKRIGRLKSDLAWEFLGEFDERFTLDAEIADITGGGEGQNYGCNIKIIGEHFDE